jgi:hypothetical protein
MLVLDFGELVTHHREMGRQWDCALIAVRQKMMSMTIEDGEIQILNQSHYVTGPIFGGETGEKRRCVAPLV